MLKCTLFYLTIIFVFHCGVYSRSQESKLKVDPTAFLDLNKPFYEFTCEGNLKSQQWISWYQNKTSIKEKVLITLISHKDGLKKIHLVLPLDQTDSNSVIYCITHSEHLKNGKKVFKTISESNGIHITFDKDIYPLKKPETPQVVPAAFVDSGEPVVEFTCWGNLKSYESQTQRLSWYQVKGNNNEKLINITEQKTYYSYKKVEFRKILEASDNESYIYCAIETSHHKGPYVKSFISDNITFTIRRKPTDVWGPWIDSEMYAKNDSFKMIKNHCSAYLKKGQVLTWFQIRESEKPIRRAMVQQNGTFGRLELISRMTLEPSDTGSTIYCAKENIRGNDFEPEFVTTEESERIQIKFEDQNALGGPVDIILAITIPVLISVVAAVTYWVLRRRHSAHKAPTAAIPSPTGTPQPKPVIAARPYPAESKPLTDTSTLKRPEPTSRPKPQNSIHTKETKRPIYPTATRPAIAARPKLSVCPMPKTNPTATLTSEPFVTPIPSEEKENSETTTIYGNFITLFSDMEADQVTYAVLDLPQNKSSKPSICTTQKTSESVDAPKTSASTDIKGTTLATSESSPYAEIIGIYKELS